jgi:hypothetical protein
VSVRLRRRGCADALRLFWNPHLVEHVGRLFDQLLACQPKNLDASHSFYLGYELAKATIARTLGKHYEQDEALRWGFLTEEEAGHRLTRRRPDASPPT